MTKRIFALLTAFVLCLVMSVTAFAANTEIQYVSDNSEMYLDADIREKLNGYAEFLSDEVGVDIIFVYTHITDFEECIKSLPLGKRQEQIIMIEDEESWDLYAFGEIGKDFSEGDVSAARDAYNAPDTFSDSVASYIKATAKLVAQKKGKTVSFAEGENSFDPLSTKTGPNNTIILDKPDRMVDMADVLSSSEEAELRTKLNELSERGGIDVSVVTVYDLMGKTLEEYANDFYDYNWYGMGAGVNGIILVVRINDGGTYSKGNSWISTTGTGVTAFNGDGIQFIGKQITPELKKEEYYAAFTEFVTWSDDFVTQYNTKGAYTSNNMPEGDFQFGKFILISLVIGLVVAFIVTASMKKKLKTVSFKAGASDYMKPGTLNITSANDVFLYTNVVKREKPKSDSSSGSSSSSSSSGRSHGGGGF